MKFNIYFKSNNCKKKKRILQHWVFCFFTYDKEMTGKIKRSQINCR